MNISYGQKQSVHILDMLKKKEKNCQVSTKIPWVWKNLVTPYSSCRIFRPRDEIRPLKAIIAHSKRSILKIIQ